MAGAHDGDRIAICGLGLIVPGKGVIDAPDKFWDLLVNGEDASGFIPPWKWNCAAYYDRDKTVFAKTSVARGNFVDEDKMMEFDASFFRLSQNEASVMDPQQRCALRCTIEAMWDACIDPERYAGRAVDVVVGTMHTENMETIDKLNKDPGGAVVGHARTMCPNRLSFFFDFRGRSLSVDTACSSSMQALDLVVEGLQQRKSEMGIVVGANFLATPRMNIAFQKLGTISVDGRCKYCDVGANGYGRGEAVVAIVLKRLKDAVQDGNTIYCTIVDARSNHDGAKDFATFPSREAQQALIESVYNDCGLNPTDTQYLEAHGTGTDAGDRTELAAVHGAMIEGE